MQIGFARRFGLALVGYLAIGLLFGMIWLAAAGMGTSAAAFRYVGF
jgi:hypothetical protein